MAKKESTIGRILKSWREASGLDQGRISDLSYEVAGYLRENGHENYTGIRRQHIGRLENDQVSDPEARTLRVLAYTLVEAHHRQGLEPTADGEALFQILLSRFGEKITVKDVSAEAAELDSLMAMIKDPTRQVMYIGFIASARAQIDAWIAYQRSKRGDETPRNDE